jgi:hypothetical protein
MFYEQEKSASNKTKQASFQHGVSNTMEEVSFEPVLSRKVKKKKCSLKNSRGRDSRGTSCFSDKQKKFP